jgi:hypothetical protein
MMVMGQYSQLLAPAAHSMFVDQLELESMDVEYSQILNETSSDKPYEDDIEFSGLPAMVLKEEGMPISYEQIIQGGTYRTQFQVYGQGVRASFELLQNDQYGLIKKIPSFFVRTALDTKERNASNILNLGFTTQTTVDGVSLFNASHPLLGGAPATVNVPDTVSGSTSITAGTFPNRPTTDVSLSYAGIQLMYNMMERQVDGRGMLVKSRMETLVIPPELRWTAEELLQPGGRPYTADNTKNVIADKGLKPFIYHYLTSLTAWFCLAAKGKHTLTHWDRYPMDEDFGDDFDTRSVKWIAYYGDGNSSFHWRGTWGTDGVA